MWYDKPEYKEGDLVQFTLDGNIDNLLVGHIRGKAVSHIIDIWIVELPDSYKFAGYQYSCAVIQHTFIRLLGENRPFGCENKD